nr:ribonuclease H-like domain, reverse transcriptase, RNA-dependent DNA polymerase [Tanacetum cinerariifolium]
MKHGIGKITLVSTLMTSLNGLTSKQEILKSQMNIMIKDFNQSKKIMNFLTMMIMLHQQETLPHILKHLTPSTRSSIVNSQVTPNISTQSHYQSNNDSIQTTNSPSHFDYTPLRGFITLNDLYENTDELLLAEDEPKNYKEASSDQKWIEAMKAELDSINRNNTWKLTTLPKGHNAIGLKWVFKTKRDANGNIIKHKARLVAKGYIQEHAIDFEEVFAPVARMETIRLLLAIAASNKWEVHHLDVKSAFLHGDLKEELYVTQPEGFVKKQDQGKVYRLIKALYGIRQAPCAWNIKLDNTLKSLATAAATQALWLKRLLSKLTHSEEYKVTIRVDNKSAISLIKNPVFREMSKHIDKKYHFIRECVEREDIQVEFISGEYQKADILTKALPKIRFLTMRQLIGLKNLRSSVCD